MMYNRYVPQADGSYRRSRMEEPRPKPPQPKPQPCEPQPCEPRPPQPPSCEPVCAPPPPPCREERSHQNQPIGSFLRQLLPSNFDTADLIIVLLLLLLAGDCEEDRTTAMLTLVLYLFL